jgi:hypothetical protein
MGARSNGLEIQLDQYVRAAVGQLKGLVAGTRWTRRRWSKFAAVGSATLASPSITSATIVHVVPPTPISVDVDLQNGLAFDVDGDGDLDLTVGAGQEGTIPLLVAGLASGIGQNIVVGQSPLNSQGRMLIERYDLGSPVVPFGAIGGSVVRTSIVGSAGGFGNGMWSLSDTGYAGVGLWNAGQSQRQAGWLKIRTRPSGHRLDKVEVLEWAYETVPGRSIIAGDTGSGVSTPLPGDYNGNGTVGAEDADLWRSKFGTAANPAGSGADGNGDGRVNAADFIVWRNHANAGSGSQAQTLEVPEPTALTLGVLALGAAGIAALRKRSIAAAACGLAQCPSDP